MVSVLVIVVTVVACISEWVIGGKSGITDKPIIVLAAAVIATPAAIVIATVITTRTPAPTPISM